MRRGSKKAEPDETPGAPQWMVTFCDSMTLMLTFFVLLFSFSSFNEDVFEKLSMTFAEALSGVGPLAERDKGAFLPTEQIVATEELDEGSEKPTLIKGLEDNLKEDAPAYFRLRKVFLISSERIFWGRGTLISAEGRRIMTKMASFLKEVPTRVVVSESGLASEDDAEQLSLPRAWAVMEYLTKEHDLNKKWFSISAASTLAPHQLSLGSRLIGAGEPERTVEIVLLERSIYN